MLEWKDIVHLPQIEPLVEQVVAGRPGLVLVAGLDPPGTASSLPERRQLSVTDSFPPSGRAAILRILLRQMLEAQPGIDAVAVVGADATLRLPQSLRSRVRFLAVEALEDYTSVVQEAVGLRPGLLVVDRLDPSGAAVVLEAAGSGLQVLSQLDTVLRGAAVARHLRSLGVPQEHMTGLAWIVTVQRLATLCPHCKEPAQPDPAHLADLERLRDRASDAAAGVRFCRALGCSHCGHTGRSGEVAAFDFFCVDHELPDLALQPSLLPLEIYLLGLAEAGYLSVDDVLYSETDRLWRTYCLFASSQRAAAEAQSHLGRRLVELEAANRVLQQRTEALVSLEGIGQALIEATDLGELAGRLCRHARDLCGAERAILYFLKPGRGNYQILAVHGWDRALVGRILDATQVGDLGFEPTRHDGLPPGVSHDPAAVTSDALRAGLCVPLTVEDRQVGLMIVHTSQRSWFAPGEVALLQTFANQAALAVQRASLVEALQNKIEQLEAAQLELVQKERMERELELAQQLQQSVLPAAFPRVPGYTFAGRSEPARWVGGDFYDVIRLDEDRLGLVVGDVSDKGMPAALYMAQVHSLLRASSRRAAGPRDLLQNLHSLLRESGGAEMFVTVFYGVLDGSARRLIYTRAGHDRPMLLRGGRILSLGGQGTVLGFPALEDLFLTEEEIDLTPGDRLVLYSDGLIDVRSSAGQPFGLERLKSTLLAVQALPADELCAAVFSELTVFAGGGEPYDDMTLLVMAVD